MGLHHTTRLRFKVGTSSIHNHLVGFDPTASPLEVGCSYLSELQVKDGRGTLTPISDLL